MTTQLVDHAHTDSYIVLGCNLVQPHRKMDMFLSGCSHLAVASQLHRNRSHNCAQRLGNPLLLCTQSTLQSRCSHVINESLTQLRPTLQWKHEC